MKLLQIPPDGKTFDEMIGNLNSIGGEPRSAVLITHLYMEYLLDWILRNKISNPDKILKRTKFYSKLKLIESFQILSDEIMHELWIVNEVRNQFAHEININSSDFQNTFSEKVHRMKYYNDNALRFEGMGTRHTYNMIMMRIFSVLKHEYDQLLNLIK
ncbi:MAG: hypothetical protein ACYDAJ_02870 [Nitrosotalea sp.]